MHAISEQLMMTCDIPGIIDAHTHIYKPKIGHAASVSIGAFYETDMSAQNAVADELLTRAAEAGVVRSLVCSAATSYEQVAIINQFIADQCQAHPEFIGLGTAHHEVKDPAALMADIYEKGLIGIKIHSDFQKIALDDARMMPLYKEAARYNMIVLFHVGDERYDFSAPVRVARVLEEVPGLRVQAAHFGCCRIPDIDPHPLKDAPVMFDTSSMMAWAGREKTLRLMDTLGTDRMMWGTDFPMWSHEDELTRLADLGLSVSEQAGILYHHAHAFYGAPLIDARS